MDFRSVSRRTNLDAGFVPGNLEPGSNKTIPTGGKRFVRIVSKILWKSDALGLTIREKSSYFVKLLVSFQELKNVDTERENCTV